MDQLPRSLGQTNEQTPTWASSNFHAEAREEAIIFLQLFQRDPLGVPDVLNSSAAAETILSGMLTLLERLGMP
jgi:hypothetical protein